MGMRYQVCPKCNGQGYVSKPPYVQGAVHHWASAAASFICDVCKGTKTLFMNEDKGHTGKYITY